MLLIQDHEIRSIISMTDAISCMEEGFSDFYDGLFTVPQRSKMEIDGATILSMPAYRNEGKYFTLKVVSVFQSLSKNHSKMIQSSILVFNSKDGTLIASLDGDEITAIRTGAVSGLATKFFAATKSNTVAVFGTGSQAVTQIEAMINVRPIEKIFVFSRGLKSSKKFSKYLLETHSINSIPGELKNLKEVDIICTATPSKTELFSLNNLKKGVHINAIGSFKPSMREISNDVIIDSKVIVDSIASCKEEAGDLIQAEESSSWRFNDVFMELGSIAKGKKTYKESIHHNSLFKSVGLGFQDLVITELLLKRLGK